MRDEMAMTRNVRRFLAAIRELNDRPMSVQGMGVLWGEPGEGKSSAVAFALNSLDGVYVRAGSGWSPIDLLCALMVELGQPELYRRAPMVKAAVRCLSETPRPIFIDEADYLFKKPETLDILRDIYDLTDSPVILIGMEDFARKLQAREKFARRITQWVRFFGIDEEDARTLADTVCEVHIADDLLSYIHSRARKNIGHMVTGMARVERFGKLNKLDSVAREQWGNNPLFYSEPKFAKRRRA